MEISEEHSLIIGYIKKFYHEYIITDIAKHITLWFGSRYDMFDEFNTSNKIQISGLHGRIIKRMQKWDARHYNAFGYNIISSGEIKTWRLKLIKTKARFTSCIQIGIIESDTVYQQNEPKKMQGSFCQMTHFNGYGMYAKNGRLFHGSYYCPHKSKYYRIPALTTGDIINVTLDLSSNNNKRGGMLTFNINDSKNNFKAFDDIDVNLNYVLAVALYALYDTVLLMQDF